MANISIDLSIGDGTLTVIAEILAEIDRTSNGLSRAKEVAANTSLSAEIAAAHFFNRGSSQAVVFQQMGTLGRAAGARTQDIEILLTQEKFNSGLSGTNLQPIRIDEDSHSIDIEPTGQPRLYWTRPGQPQAMQDCFFLQTTWALSSQGADPVPIVVLHQLMMTIDQNSHKLGVLETNSPRFFDAHGQLHDPFVMLPRENGLRSRLKERLYSEVTKAMTEFQAAIPTDADTDLPRPFSPHFYVVGVVLGLVGRTLHKRRTPYPLWERSISFNLGMRLKSDHIRPRIAAQAAGQGLEVQNISFDYGAISLAVHKHESRSFLFIDVDVDVDLRYSVRFPEDMPGELFTEAIQTWWHYDINAHNCWPICDKVVDAAVSEVRTEIAKAQLLTFPFKDFRPKARRASTMIEPHGLVIMMEITNGW